VQTDTDDLPPLISQGTNVNILPEATHLHQLPGDAAQLVYTIGKLDLQDAATSLHPFVVLPRPEEVHLLLLLVPVAAYALEAGGTIVEGMGHYPYLSLLQGHKLILEKGVTSHSTLLSFVEEIISPICWQKQDMDRGSVLASKE